MLETASDGAQLGNATDRSTAALLCSRQAERKQMASSRDTSPRELALQRCEENIAWYVSQKRLQRFLDTALQLSIILAAGATAFLASFDYPPDMKWIVVLPAVITTVATGMSSAFRFRNKYVSFATAAERLRWAKLRFEIRSEDGTDSRKNLEEFVDTMESILSAELSTWSDVLISKTEKSEPSKLK